MVGILGASGSIGSYALMYIMKLFQDEQIKVGVRSKDKLISTLSDNDIDIDRLIICELDIESNQQIKTFFSDCTAILNCIGQSYSISKRLMELAVDIGVDFIDVGLIDKKDIPTASNVSLICGGGTVPGLSGIVQNIIAEEIGYAKSIDYIFLYEISDRFSLNGAKDYLEGVFKGNNKYTLRLGNVYRNPKSYLNRKKAFKPVEVDTFPYKSRIFPYFDEESEHTDNVLLHKCRDAYSEFYSLVSGNYFLDFLNKQATRISKNEVSIDDAAHLLVEASAKDVEEHGRYVNITAAAKWLDGDGMEHNKLLHIKTIGQLETSAAVASLLLKETSKKRLKKGNECLYSVNGKDIIEGLITLGLIQTIEDVDRTLFFN